jgi:hypothetical protein
MSSNIHSLKNRPDNTRHIQDAFKTWEPLMADMKRQQLFPESRTEIRVFLSWMFDHCQGTTADLNSLVASGVITDEDRTDWLTK